MTWGRAYFALQAIAGAAWWIAVALSPFVRAATLGHLDAPLIAVLDVPLFVLASAAAAIGVRGAAWVNVAWTGLVAVALAEYGTVSAEAGWGVLLMAAAAAASLGALCLVVRGALPTEWLLTGPFRFRVAPIRRSAAGNLAVTGLQIVVFWGTCLVVIPVVIRLLELRWRLAVPVPPAVPITGGVLLLLASALGIWSAVAMSVTGRGTPLPSSTANLLVTSGPYRYVRNPMAIAGITQGVAVGLLLSSWLVVIYALLGSLVWNYAIRPHEEADMDARFGDPYRRYRDAVRCWVPAMHPFEPARRQDPVEGGLGSTGDRTSPSAVRQ